MSNGRPQHDEDYFAHTRMSLGDHIEELRGCLWRAVKWFLLAMVIGVFVAKYALAFISAPIERELMTLHKERLEKMRKKLEGGDPALTEANVPRPVKIGFTPDTLAVLAKSLGGNAPVREEPLEVEVLMRGADVYDLAQTFGITARPPSLIALTVLEGIITWIRVAIYCGFVIAAPLIIRELWGFIAAGLYPQEKALVWRSLPLAIGLFLAGVALCQFVLLPIGIHYLLSFNAWLGFESELRLTDWLSFAIFTPIVFGVAFQTPLVMFLLDRVGIVTVDFFIAYWRVATFVILVLSAFLAPAPDPVSMLALGIPVCGLYWLGIGMCIWWPRPKVDLDVEEPQETVEV